jgi:hypothetical protein
LLKKFILLSTLLLLPQKVPQYVQKAENFLVDFYAKRNFDKTEQHLASGRFLLI